MNRSFSKKRLPLVSVIIPVYNVKPYLAEALDSVISQTWQKAMDHGNVPIRVPDFTPPLLLRGSEFRLKVWHELLTIPYGHTLTYGSLARRIGCRSPQAVGGAVGHNPIALIVPCHRVVGAGGALTGYAAGLGRKAALLNMEADKQSLCKEPIKRHRT